MHVFSACIRNCFLDTSYIPKSLITNLCKHAFKSCFQACTDLYKHQKHREKKKEKESVKSAALIVLSLPKNPSLGTVVWTDNASPLQNIFIHRSLRPLWMKSVLLHHYYAYMGKCWSSASGKSHLYIHKQSYTSPHGSVGNQGFPSSRGEQSTGTSIEFPHRTLLPW